MLRTRICDLFGIRYPILQAGMAGYTGPELVAAVSNAGGLGILGGLTREPDALERDIEAIRERTESPFGVNIVLADPHAEKLEILLRERVPVISTSWGDPAQVVERAHSAGLKVLHQVNTVAGTVQAAAAGADAIIAQGGDGGGHVGRIGTLALVPAVVDAAGGIPVVAAGGIADGRGIAAALMLGAEGVLIGTRFLATREAPITAGWKAAIVAARPEDAWQTPFPDLLWGTEWPGATTRVLANDLARRWAGREGEVAAAREAIVPGVQAAEERGDPAEIILWAGQSAGLVHDIIPAGELVERLAADAERVLRERPSAAAG